MDLHNIREDYSKRELSEAECHADPIVQFEQWLNEAIHAEVNGAGQRSTLPPWAKTASPTAAWYC